jgi:hypothetical protein
VERDKLSGTPFELEQLLDAGEAEREEAPPGTGDREAAEAIDAQILALLVSP